jgi:polyene macrolide polyketide synthase
MQALPPGGAMIAIEATEAEAREALEGETRASVAAINGPRAIVVSGDDDVVTRVCAAFGARGRRTSRLRTSHAFHSHRMDPMLDAFATAVRPLAFGLPAIPLVSNLTGALAGDEVTEPDYWIRHVRHAVRFGEGIGAVAKLRTTTVIEIGPESVLSAIVKSGLSEEDAAGIEVLPCARKNQPADAALSLVLGALHVRGHAVDWRAFFLPLKAKAVALPTYPFRRERYWLDAPGAAPRFGGAGSASDHPLLGESLELAGTASTLFSAEVSLERIPWLKDHVVFGCVLFPATGFLEIALAAAARTGAARVDELTLEAPLVLEEGSPTWLQTTVSAPDAGGCRSITLHARPSGSSAWTLHARGTLGADDAEAPARTRCAISDGGVEVWPPAGATPVVTDDLYPKLERLGFAYGDAFRLLRAAWGRGDELFVEVVRAGAREALYPFALDPALADAALHALALRPVFGDVAALPFVWTAARTTGNGVPQEPWRVRLARGAANGSVAVQIFDARGSPFAEIGALLLRPADAGGMRGTISRAAKTIYALEWLPIAEREMARVRPLGAASFADTASLGRVLDGGERPDIVVADFRGVAAGGPADETARALGWIQAWYEDARLTPSRLCVLTRSAVAIAPRDGAVDLARAPLVGLVRSARAELADRDLGYVDIDDDPASLQALPLALGAASREIAVRKGKLFVPRLTRARVASNGGDWFDPDGTILLTGATGGLGACLARHLVERHRARHLLLLSRHGERSHGATALRQALEAAGATVTLRACDLADESALASCLALVPRAHPLTAIIHTAAVLEDAPLAGLTSALIGRVFGPKLGGAMALHALTRALPLRAFVLFSSAAAILGSPGQANYAAANAALDALAHERRKEGLPASVLAWGPWQKVGMAARLSERHRDRIARSGLVPLEAEEALSLFDRCVQLDQSPLVPMVFDGQRLRENGTRVPEVLVDFAVPRSTVSGDPSGALRSRLAALSETERARAMRDVLRREIARVFGLPAGAAIDPETPLKDLGLDSLMAVELKNSLSALTGTRLSTSLAFDYPTLDALAAYLEGELGTGARPPSERDIARPVETAIDAMGVEELIKLALER